MRPVIAIAGAGLTAAALAFGGARAQEGALARTDSTATEIEAGKRVYAHWCAPCHAAEPGLAGTMSLEAKYEGRVPAALENRTDLTPDLIAYFVRNGVAWMPPFRPTEISDTELAALSRYLTAPLDDRGSHAMLLAEEMAGKQGDEQ